MKKSIFAFFIILTLCANTVFAQERPSHNSGKGKRLTLGISVGSGIDWMIPRSDSLDIRQAGGVATLRYGIPMDINFTKANHYYFSTGLYFQHLGGRSKFATGLVNEDGKVMPDTEFKRTYRTIYFTIPTGIKLKTPDFSNFVIAANFGLQHSFAISAKATDKYTFNGETQSFVHKNYYNQTFFFREAGYIGLGLEYIIKDDFRAWIYANYAYSFTNYFAYKNKMGEKGNLMSLEISLGCNF